MKNSFLYNKQLMNSYTQPKLETFVLYLSCTAAAAPEEIELELLNFQFWIWVKLQVVLNKLSIVEKEKNDYFAYLSSPVLQKKFYFRIFRMALTKELRF